jgi:transcriptional regulator with XRE-family HTH domain
MTDPTRAALARQWRESLGISQVTLAAMIGDYSASSIRNFELGRYRTDASGTYDGISDRAWRRYAESCQKAYKLKEPPF